MKYLYLIFLPLLIFAQDVDRAERAAIPEATYDWSMEDREGCILEIRSDAINFEEQWMYLDPAGVAVSSTGGFELSLNELEPPFTARIFCYGIHGRTYIKSLTFQKQLVYDAAHNIIE